jgi:hypothetical protein
MRAATGVLPRRAGVKRQLRAAVRACSANGSAPSTTFAFETEPSRSTTNSSATSASPSPPSGYATSVLLCVTGGVSSKAAWARNEAHQSSTASQRLAAKTQRKMNIRASLCPVFKRRTHSLHRTSAIHRGRAVQVVTDQLLMTRVGGQLIKHRLSLASWRAPLPGRPPCSAYVSCVESSRLDERRRWTFEPVTRDRHFRSARVLFSSWTANC